MPILTGVEIYENCFIDVPGLIGVVSLRFKVCVNFNYREVFARRDKLMFTTSLAECVHCLKGTGSGRFAIKTTRRDLS